MRRCGECSLKLPTSPDSRGQREVSCTVVQSTATDSPRVTVERVYIWDLMKDRFSASRGFETAATILRRAKDFADSCTTAALPPSFVTSTLRRLCAMNRGDADSVVVATTAKLLPCRECVLAALRTVVDCTTGKRGQRPRREATRDVMSVPLASCLSITPWGVFDVSRESAAFLASQGMDDLSTIDTSRNSLLCKREIANGLPTGRTTDCFFLGSFRCTAPSSQPHSRFDYALPSPSARTLLCRVVAQC